MKLEDQVVSLELAKKLKVLGVGQTASFWWCRPVANFHWILKLGKPDGYAEKIAAFSIAELGKMLPDFLKGSAIIFWKKFFQNKMIYFAQPEFGRKYEMEIPCFEADTEANARAAMLVYLIEHGIVKP